MCRFIDTVYRAATIICKDKTLFTIYAAYHIAIHYRSAANHLLIVVFGPVSELTIYRRSSKHVRYSMSLHSQLLTDPL